MGDTALDKIKLGSEGESNRSAWRREWSARHLDESANDLLARDSNAFLHQSLSSPCLSVIAKAEGIWIEDLAGNRFMDFHGNGVHHVGYGHPRIKRAISKQLDDLPFAPRRFACLPAIELAEKLGSVAPAGLNKVLFATGGSDAIEIAMKIARAKTGRFKTISFWDSFHGAGFGAASVGGESIFRSHIAGPLLPGSEHVAPFDCFRCPYGHETPTGKPNLEKCKIACARMIQYMLEREGDVAAVIAEPIRSIPYVPPPGFWELVRDACKAHGAMLIFDEINNGLGKTGRLFTCEHDGVTPDIVVLGKSLGGGALPIAAVICSADLDIAPDFAIGHYTHEKNPVTTRVALTTLEIIEDEGLVENAREVGSHTLMRLEEMQNKYSIVGDVRGKGLLNGVEFVLSKNTREPAGEISEMAFYRLLERGVLTKITRGNVLTLSPPLTITKQEMDSALDALDGIVSDLQAYQNARAANGNA